MRKRKPKRKQQRNKNFKHKNPRFSAGIFDQFYRALKDVQMDVETEEESSTWQAFVHCPVSLDFIHWNQYCSSLFQFPFWRREAVT